MIHFQAYQVARSLHQSSYNGWPLDLTARPALWRDVGCSCVIRAVRGMRTHGGQDPKVYMIQPEVTGPAAPGEHANLPPTLIVLGLSRSILGPKPETRSG